MLSHETNLRMCLVGPGTPMGKLLRAYWLPLLYSHELPEADGPPRRIRLLGENLVAFRDSAGRVGLLDHHCPHRRASLFFGRNEGQGLRCLYHGWKFDIEGQCLDMPNEPDDCAFKAKVRARAYPCRELEGVIWTFMGEGLPPEPPDLGWARAPLQRKSTLSYQRECNWVQAMEGDFDSSHLGFLHREFAPGAAQRRFEKVAEGDALRALTQLDPQPLIEVSETDIGVVYGARRRSPADGDYWRITQFMLPFYTSVPAYDGMNRLKIWVPMDDTHTMVWEANWSHKDLSPEQQRGWHKRIGPSGFLPDDGSWLGRGRLAAHAGNDYLIDRERQRSVNFSGMESVTPVQDGAMQESMGALVDRSQEHLSASDAAIIRLRASLLQAAAALEQGQAAPGARDPGLYRAHGEQVLLRAGESWHEAYAALMQAHYQAAQPSP